MIKKQTALVVLCSFVLYLFAGLLVAQETSQPAAGNQPAATAQPADAAQPAVNAANATPAAAPASAPAKEMAKPEKPGFLKKLAISLVGSGFVKLFNDGGFAMWPILVLCIWGLAVVIWKMVALSYAKIDVNNFLDRLIPLIKEKKFDEAVELCHNTRGPLAIVLEQGLTRANNGAAAVEKAIESAAALEMAYLDKGQVPLSTTIALAPMFGFFGTLVGMVQAFDAIAKAGEVDASIVAVGIRVALITSIAGLAVAMPMQFFYNIFQSMADGIIIDMQKGTDKVIDAVVETKGA